jgi:hypothetical protein
VPVWWQRKKRLARFCRSRTGRPRSSAKRSFNVSLVLTWNSSITFGRAGFLTDLMTVLRAGMVGRFPMGGRAVVGRVAGAVFCAGEGVTPPWASRSTRGRTGSDGKTTATSL